MKLSEIILCEMDIVYHLFIVDAALHPLTGFAVMRFITMKDNSEDFLWLFMKISTLKITRHAVPNNCKY